MTKFILFPFWCLPGNQIWKFFSFCFYFIVIIMLLEGGPFQSLEYQLYDTTSAWATVAQHPEWHLMAHFALIMNMIIWIQNIFISAATLKFSLTCMVFPSCLSCTHLLSEHLNSRVAFLFQSEGKACVGLSYTLLSRGDMLSSSDTISWLDLSNFLIKT